MSRKWPFVPLSEFLQDPAHAIRLADQYGGVDIQDDNGAVRMHISGNGPPSEKLCPMCEGSGHVAVNT